MTDNKTTTRVLIVIGAITLIVGSYSLITGAEFGTYFPALLLGAVLMLSPFLTSK